MWDTKTRSFMLYEAVIPHQNVFIFSRKILLLFYFHLQFSAVFCQKPFTIIILPRSSTEKKIQLPTSSLLELKFHMYKYIKYTAPWNYSMSNCSFREVIVHLTKKDRLVKTPVRMFQSFEYWLLVANPSLNNLLQNQLLYPTRHLLFQNCIHPNIKQDAADAARTPDLLPAEEGCLVTVHQKQWLSIVD